MVTTKNPLHAARANARLIVQGVRKNNVLEGFFIECMCITKIRARKDKAKVLAIGFLNHKKEAKILGLSHIMHLPIGTIEQRRHQRYPLVYKPSSSCLIYLLLLLLQIPGAFYGQIITAAIFFCQSFHFHMVDSELCLFSFAHRTSAVPCLLFD